MVSPKRWAGCLPALAIAGLLQVFGRHTGLVGRRNDGAPRLLRCALFAAAVAGEPDAVSGASVANVAYAGKTITLTASATNANPSATLIATNGVHMGFRTTVYVGELSAAGYSFQNLPPGMSGNALGVAGGTPGAPGNYHVEVTGYLDGQSLWQYDLLHGRYYLVDIFVTVLPGVNGNVPAPVINTQPADQSVPVGGTAVFQVGATGTNLTYQWFSDGVALSTVTNAAFTLKNVAVDFAGTFQVIISNAGGSVTSAPVKLTVLPAFTPQPWAVANPLWLHRGEFTQLTAVAAGPPPLTYQWFKEGAPAGPPGPTLALGPASTNTPGVYAVVVASPSGNATNTPVNIQVGDPLDAMIQTPGTTRILAFNSLPGRLYAADVAQTPAGPWTVWTPSGLTNATPLPSGSPVEFFRIRALDP
jgi:hypothetical protein